MEYIVSHRANYEPDGHHDYPDKRFDNLDEAQAYYNEQRDKCRKEADKHIEKYPALYAQDYMREDLFHDDPEDILEKEEYWGDIAGFSFHENYAYHIWTLSYEA